MRIYAVWFTGVVSYKSALPLGFDLRWILPKERKIARCHCSRRLTLYSQVQNCVGCLCCSFLRQK